MRRSEHASPLLLVALALLPSLLLLPHLLDGSIPLSMDPLMYFFPMRTHAGALIRAGEWPWWNRCLLAGDPLFANPQAALAYPPHWPMLLAPPGRASGFLFLFPAALHLGAWAALSALAARRLGAPRFAALWCGALCLAGNYGWSRFQFGNYMNALPWAPLWVVASERFASGNRRGSVAIGAVAVAMPILGGAHQLAAYFLAGLAIFAAFLAATDPDARRPRLLFLATTFAIGVALAAPGWLPQRAYLAETIRAGGLAPGEALGGAYGSPLELARALIGPRLGAIADAEDSAAIGPLALLLAFAIPPRGKLRRPWAAFLAVGLLLSLTTLRAIAEPLYRAFPALAMFHGPRRALGAAHWGLILASGFGLAGVAERFAGAGKRRIDRDTTEATSEREIFGNNPPHEDAAIWSAEAMPPLSHARPRLAPSQVASRGARTQPPDPRPASAEDASDPGAGHGPAGESGGMASALQIQPSPLEIPASPPFIALVLLAFLSLAFLSHSTATTTALRFVPASEIVSPAGGPLLARAGLAPGERFFVVDRLRAWSYEYRRHDLPHSALPNLGSLRGFEDLGGYEPARSARLDDWVGAASRWPGNERAWPKHFALASPAFDGSDGLADSAASTAILPRWGLPAALRPAPGEAGRHVARAPNWSAPCEARIVFLESTPSASPSPGPPGAERLLVLGGATGPVASFSLTAAIEDPPGGLFGEDDPIPDLDPAYRLVSRRVRVDRDALAAGLSSAPPDPWVDLRLAPDDVPIGVFFWSDGLAARFRSLAAAGTFMACRVAGAAPRVELDCAGAAPCEIVSTDIAANRLRIVVRRDPSRPATLLVRDSWRRGWSATEDGIPVSLGPSGEDGGGPWRVAALPARPLPSEGVESVVEERFFPPTLLAALGLAVLGCALLVGAESVARPLRKRNRAPATETVDVSIEMT